MSFKGQWKAKWKSFYRKHQSGLDKLAAFFKKISDKVVPAWSYVRKNKKLFLAAPVAVIALLMAFINLFKLPALVGLGLEGNGEFSFEIIREVAVLGPLVITAICLLLLFASKRTLTPWMVSMVSLLLPLMILITNTFPS